MNDRFNWKKLTTLSGVFIVLALLFQSVQIMAQDNCVGVVPNNLSPSLDRMDEVKELFGDYRFDRDRAVKYGFVGKNGLSNIVLCLNRKQEFSENYKYAWVLGLDYIDHAEMPESLVLVSRLPLTNQLWFFQVLSQRIVRGTNVSTPRFESLADRLISSHSVYTKGMMFVANDYENWISDIIKIAKMEPFKSPRYANQFCRLIWHVMDNFSSKYDPKQTEIALRYLVVDSVADDEIKLHLIQKIVSPSTAGSHRLTKNDTIERISISEVPLAVIWYLNRVRAENITASKIWNQAIDNCKENADWIQKVRSGALDEEAGFKQPLRNSLKAKERALKWIESTDRIESKF